MVAVASLHESRRAAEERLVALRQKLHEAEKEKKASEKQLAVALHADRLAVRDQTREFRARAIALLRDHMSAARGAAKLMRLSRLEEVRRTYGSTIEGIKAAMEVERRHQAELARIDREERTRRAEIHQAHERSVATGAVRSALLGKVAPIVTRGGRVLQGPGESQGEAILRHARQHTGKVHAALQPHLASTVETTQRAVREQEAKVRALGGNVNVRPPRPKPASTPKKGTSVATKEKASKPKPIASTSPASPTSPGSSSRAKPKKTAAKKNARKVAKKTAAKKHSRPTTTVPSTRRPAAKGPPPRRKVALPRSGGGTRVEDLLRERAEIATAKAGRAKRGAKKPSGPRAAPPAPAPAPVPPALVAQDLPAAANAANQNANVPVPARVTSGYVDRVQPYRVRASCGHIVIRPMREATAGVPFSEDVVLDAPHGRACEACEAKRDYAAHAPRRAPDAEEKVKAPELTDTAQIAARVRADIAEAVRTKTLPPAKYSVRTSKYSMGSSITVEASALPFPVLNPAAFHLEGKFVSFNRDNPHGRYTHQAETVLAKLESIVKAYHWDKSDLMADYHHSRFHYSIRLDEGDEFKRIEETIKRAAATAPSPSTSVPSVATPKPPPAPLELEPQSPAPTKRGRGARPRGVQQSLSLDSPLLHGAPRPTATAGSAPPTANRRETAKPKASAPQGTRGQPSSSPGFDEALAQYLRRSQENLIASYARSSPTLKPPVLSAESGRRYVRIVRTDTNGSRDVFSFIDQTNGDILKADGWKKPAPGARGNVFSLGSAGSASVSPAAPSAPHGESTKRKPELEALEAMTRPGGPLHGAKLEELRPLLEKVRTLTPAPGESRTQALWRYARAHPEVILSLLEPKKHSAATTPHVAAPSIPPGRPTKGDREPRYGEGEVVESKWGERAQIEGWVPTEWGTLQYRVVRGHERGEEIHDLWPAEVISRAVAKSPEPAPNSYEQKKAARVERLRSRSEKVRAEAEGTFARERAISGVIPLGQPILIGHHSEKRHRRDLERIRLLATKGVALSKQADELARRADAAEESTAISSDDPEALPKLRNKLARLEKSRSLMRSVNAAIRKGGDVVPRLVTLDLSEEQAKKLLEKDFAGRIGVPSYKLQNTSAEERRIKERIRQLEARAASPPPPTVTIGDGTIAEADNRVRITFPTIPPEALRTTLKREGFRWSPTEHAWQRFASPGAWHAARRVLTAHDTTSTGAAPASPNSPPPP